MKSCKKKQSNGIPPPHGSMPDLQRQSQDLQGKVSAASIRSGLLPEPKVRLADKLSPHGRRSNLPDSRGQGQLTALLPCRHTSKSPRCRQIGRLQPTQEKSKLAQVTRPCRDLKNPSKTPGGWLQLSRRSDNRDIYPTKIVTTQAIFPKFVYPRA